MNYTLEELEELFEAELKNKGFDRGAKYATVPSFLAKIAYEIYNPVKADTEISEELIAYQTVDREGDIWSNTALLFHSDEEARLFFQDKAKVLEALGIELDEEEGETLEDIEFTYYGAEGCAPNQIEFWCEYAYDVKICAMSKGFIIK